MACRQCGARIAPRSQWCSLCLTPLPPPARPAASVTPATPRPAGGTGAVPASEPDPEVLRRAEAMLLELAVESHARGVGNGRLGGLLRMGRVSRFAVAFGVAAAVAGVVTGAAALAGWLADLLGR